jgi:hypothetical protein
MMRSTVGQVSAGHGLAAIHCSTVVSPEACTAACVATAVGITVAAAAASVGAWVAVAVDGGAGGIAVVVGVAGAGVGVPGAVFVSALETVIWDETGVSVGEGASAGVSVGVATLVSALPVCPGQTVEEVVSMFRTASMALGEGSWEVSVGVAGCWSIEPSAPAGTNATTAATTMATPAIARLWRAYRASTAVNAPTTRRYYGRADRTQGTP